MDDLVRWLSEQLDADAEAAREAIERVGDGHWQQRNARIVTVADREREVADYAIHECISHIVRHDPARVLREIDAKRQLLALHEPGEMEYVDGDVCMACDVKGGEPFYPCKTLRLLALPYADRPGYREEWRP